MITIKDVAQRAGVSLMTVTHVVNQTGRISDKTRKKVQSVIDELGYIPNEVARGLRNKQSKIISFITHNLQNSYYTSLATGIEETAWKHGYRMFISVSHGELERELSCLHAVVSARSDGVIMTPINDKSIPHLQFLHKKNMPCVTIGHLPDAAQYVGDHVWGNNYDSAKQLAAHLVSVGHRRIAVAWDANNAATRLRGEGFADGLREAGCYDESLVLPLQSGFKMIDTVLALPTRPTAVFFPSNMIAVEAIEQLRAYNMKVPDHLALVCFEDLPICARIDPLLTVVAQSAYEMGKEAAEKAIHLIEQSVPREPRTTVIPSKMIVRRSCQLPTQSFPCASLA
ncbi:MAG: transcriptional regulator, LacI family [Paenibacillus sp.]|nr:transcriptional regulator, LacI family [Paenibacillus sp.]